MRAAGKLLKGSHDFRNLCKMDVGNGVVNFQRTIDDVTVSLVAEDRCMEEQVMYEDPHAPSGTDEKRIGNFFANCTNLTASCDNEHSSINEENFSANSEMSTNSNDSSIGEILLRSVIPDGSSNVCVTQKQKLNASQGTENIGICSCELSQKESPADTKRDLCPKLARNQNIDCGYGMCVVTIRSKAFLWHQVRAIMAVLLLVGEGREEPCVVQHLMDIEQNPRKPQYSLASELPLCLFSTEYPSDVVKWRYSAESLARVQADLQHLWAQHAIK